MEYSDGIWGWTTCYTYSKSQNTEIRATSRKKWRWRWSRLQSCSWIVQVNWFLECIAFTRCCFLSTGQLKDCRSTGLLYFSDDESDEEENEESVEESEAPEISKLKTKHKKTGLPLIEIEVNSAEMKIPPAKWVNCFSFGVTAKIKFIIRLYSFADINIWRLHELGKF